MNELSRFLDDVSTVTPSNRRWVNRNFAILVIVNAVLWNVLGWWATPLVVAWSWYGTLFFTRRLFWVSRGAAKNGYAIGVVRSHERGSVEAQIAKQLVPLGLDPVMDEVEEWAEQRRIERERLHDALRVFGEEE